MTEAFHSIVQHFFAELKKRGDEPFLVEKQNIPVQTMTKREAAAAINTFARALHFAGSGNKQRIAFYATPSASLWISEWAALATGATTIIIPVDFSLQQVIETLVESKSIILLVDSLEIAERIAASGANLPDLKQIVHMQYAYSTQKTAIKLMSWSDFRQQGFNHPDHMSALMRGISVNDAALLIFYIDDEGNRQAIRYSHDMLMHYARRASLLSAGNVSMRKGDLILTTAPWHHRVGHIIAFYAPVTIGAELEIASDNANLIVFKDSPSVLIGTGAYFNALHQLILDQSQEWGTMEAGMLTNALAMGKRNYESMKKPGIFQRFKDSTLQATIVPKVTKLLGGRLRLMIDVDDATRYDTQIFFHTFGAELAEVPPEIFDA